MASAFRRIKAKNIIQSLISLSISLTSCVVACFAWFNFNTKISANIATSSGDLKINYSINYYCPADPNVEASKLEVNCVNITNSGMTYNSSSISSLSSFDQPNYDPYYESVYGISPFTNIIMSLSFSIDYTNMPADLAYSTLLSAVPFSVTGAKSINVSYNSANTYLLSDVVDIQFAASSAFTIADTTYAGIYKAANTYFTSTSAPTASSFGATTSSDLLPDEMSISSAMTAGTTYYLCISYNTTKISSLIDSYTQSLVLYGAKFARNFYFNLEVSQS